MLEKQEKITRNFNVLPCQLILLIFVFFPQTYTLKKKKKERKKPVKSHVFHLILNVAAHAFVIIIFFLMNT